MNTLKIKIDKKQYITEDSIINVQILFIKDAKQKEILKLVKETTNYVKEDKNNVVFKIISHHLKGFSISKEKIIATFSYQGTKYTLEVEPKNFANYSLRII
ncbi:MAG: hypothetical protein ABIL45_04225 [candidate division WOR-3 bacterium]